MPGLTVSFDRGGGGGGAGAQGAGEGRDRGPKIRCAQEERVGPHFPGQRLVGVVDVGGREEHDRDVGQRRVAAHRLAEQEAVDPRHEHVGEDRVRKPAARLLQCRVTSRRRLDLEPVVAQPKGSEPEVQSLVVHDEDAAAGGAGRGRGGQMRTNDLEQA